jgi:hypothetical protein
MDVRKFFGDCIQITTIEITMKTAMNEMTTQTPQTSSQISPTFGNETHMRSTQPKSKPKPNPKAEAMAKAEAEDDVQTKRNWYLMSIIVLIIVFVTLVLVAIYMLKKNGICD